MSNITKTVNKTSVNGSETFIYTFNVAFSGLSGPATNGKMTDFFPGEIDYILPQLGSGIQSITSSPQPGGTLITFNFGPVNNGTSISFTVSCSFGQGRRNNDTFTNEATLFADNLNVATAAAPTVTLTLDDNFNLAKFVLSSAPILPGSTIEYTLQLLNQNDPGFTLNNIVITDVLPPILSPDPSFTPVGNDNPYDGFSDPTYDGRTGSFSGNTLTFSLPSYSGGEYLIKFRAIVSSTAQPGQFINNTATWTANSVVRNEANSSLQVFEQKASMQLLKLGPLYAALAGNIQYSLQSNNTGNVPLNDYTLQDDPPSQVDITKLYFSSSATSMPSYSILIATSNAPAVYNPVLSNASGASPVIDLAPFIPAGQRVVSVRVTAPNVTLQSASNYLALYGEINNTATLNQVITNNASSSAGSSVGAISYTTAVNTTLNGKSALEITKFISPSRSTYFPLDELDLSLKALTSKGPVIDPVFTDLLPLGIDASAGDYYIEFYDLLGNVTYDSRNPGFPVPMPSYTIIKNYNNTGRTLVRWEFNNYTLEFRNQLTVHLPSIITIDSPSTFSNVGYLGNPGDNTSVVSTPFLDTPDYDNDGITNENIAQSNAVTGAILSTSAFILQKWVQGNQDLGLTQAGSGTAGSDATYTLYVTNNQSVTLQNIEVIDILPYIGDTGVMLYNVPRGSQYNVYASSVVTAKIVNILGEPVDPNPAITIEYSTSTNPVRFDQNGNPIGTGTWSPTPPADITTLKSIRIITAPSLQLQPYERLEISLTVTIPVGTSTGLTAYNSFAVRGDQVSGSAVEPLLPTEPNKIPLRVVAATGASIGNLVFEDLNNNGIYDTGEPGVNGITVELYDETGSTLITTAVTANNSLNQPGYYNFTDLTAGNYKVKFLPYGTYELTFQNLAINGSKPDPATGFTDTITLSANQIITSIIAGVENTAAPKGSIGNLVFEDLNNNGIYDAGEPGVNGVTAELYNAAGTTLLATQVTANNGVNDGYYNFTNLPAGDYKVKFTPLSGTTLTIQNLTVNGSKPDPATGFTDTIPLAEDEIITNIYAGIVKPCAPPVITTTIYCAVLNSVYDPLAGVSAVDCRGNNITSAIMVTENTVNTAVAGQYSVTYQVTDSRGQTTTKTVTIKVCDNGKLYQAVSDIIESVALQQAGIAHIINAEGEKIQKALEISENNEQILEVNASVKNMINALSQLENILTLKLNTVTCNGTCKNCCDKE